MGEKVIISFTFLDRFLTVTNIQLQTKDEVKNKKKSAGIKDILIINHSMPVNWGFLVTHEYSVSQNS